jgi:pantoate--beta-alanine ligase
MMRIIRTIKEMQAFSIDVKHSGKKIGCVPTMGYLHSGHLSLVEIAKSEADCVVSTIFVNPTQFAPNEDLSKYPRDIKSDIRKLEDINCDVCFLPDDLEMYPAGFSTFVKVSEVTRKFEGTHRPEHFQGVSTIVAKLFNAVLPDVAVFGQKDFQQALVIRKMVRDLNIPVRIITAPTIREHDGLAMSSRNVYLSEFERANALVISKSLFLTEGLIKKGLRDRQKINNVMINSLKSVTGIEIDYAVSATVDNLDEPDSFDHYEDLVLLVAVRIGKTRLIDNLLIKLK